MIIDRTHVIRLSALDRARPCPPGGSVRVDLGDVENVGSDLAWRLRGLVAGAGHVELSGSTSLQRSYVAHFLEQFAEGDQ